MQRWLEELEPLSTLMKQPDFYLSIFLPSGVTWECADGAIRTRRTATRRLIMRTRVAEGPAVSWLASARSLTKYTK